MAVSGVGCVPPSLKESGVTFRMPITSVRSAGRSANLAAGRGLRIMGRGLVGGSGSWGCSEGVHSLFDYLPSMRLMASARVAGSCN
ncbi:hypothetical protein AHiyo6_20580 [Arthrobacter sp. Hiyo6]|nr:hypothetical protein AHiyo6_20580 [Arthrobacter sp. Hiyo6]